MKLAPKKGGTVVEPWASLIDKVVYQAASVNPPGNR